MWEFYYYVNKFTDYNKIEQRKFDSIWMCDTAESNHGHRIYILIFYRVAVWLCVCVCKVSGVVKAIALHIYSHILLITAGVSKHEHVARAFVRLYLSCCDVCSRFRFISWIRIHNNLFPFRYRKYKFVLELLLLRFIYSSQPQFIQYICEFAFRFVFSIWCEQFLAVKLIIRIEREPLSLFHCYIFRLIRN